MSRSGLVFLFALTVIGGCQLNAGPSISSISPNSGPLAGGNQVVVSGGGLDFHTTVWIGAHLCSDIIFDGSGTLTCNAPAGTQLSAVNVTLINKDGQRAHLKNGYTYSNAAVTSGVTVTAISPATGSSGTSVTITGTGFVSGATVAFGSAQATSVNVVSATSITCTAPAGTGTVNVTVTVSGVPGTLSSGFTYTGTSTNGKTITTIAGSSTSIGFGGDTQQATGAQLSGPRGVAFDTDGSLLICDTGNNRLRQISVAGIISTICGTGTPGFLGDNGPADLAQLDKPEQLCVDSSGFIYIADTGNNAIRLLASGRLTTIAGTLGQSGSTGDTALATAALLAAPLGVGVDTSKAIYIADTGNNRVRRVDPTTKNIAAFAGTGTVGVGGDGAAALQATLSAPAAVVIDSSGNVYIADTGNARIRIVNSSLIISTFAGGATANLTITTYAGNGTAAFSGDNGPSQSAAVNAPRGVTVNSTGVLDIAESGDGTIRQVQ